MRAFGATREILSVEGRFGTAVRAPLSILLLMTVVAGALYGLALGSFALRPLQSIYSATKVPVLILGSTLVVLPNYYVLHAVLGLADDFAAAVRAVLSAQATLAITLASLAPITLLTYASSDSYRLAVVANGVLWLAAVTAGQVVLSRHYRKLEQRNPRHAVVRRTWGILYSVVAIQMAWMLRPFVGNPAQPPSFFRDEAWDNAFVVVARTLWHLVSR